MAIEPQKCENPDAAKVVGHEAVTSDFCPSPFGLGCRACFNAGVASERVRIQAIADAAGCHHDDVNPALIWAHGIDLNEVTPELIASPEAQAAKAAHDEAVGPADLGQVKAWQIARAVRLDPAIAKDVILGEVHAKIESALAAAEAP